MSNLEILQEMQDILEFEIELFNAKIKAFSLDEFLGKLH